MSYNADQFPEMVDGGILWFRDLTAPDPYMILPVINCFLLILSIYSTSMKQSNAFFMKFRRVYFVFPVLGIGFMCFFESVSK